MVGDKCIIRSDGLNVYIYTKVRSALIGKIILLLFNLFGWVVYIYMLGEIPFDKEKGFVFFIIGFILFLIFVLGRYTLWNFWGEESLRINANSINFFRSYGIFVTKEKKIIINRLGYSYESVRYFDEIEYGNVIFLDYDENDDPKIAYQTSILIKKTDYEKMCLELGKLYENKTLEEYNNILFSAN